MLDPSLRLLVIGFSFTNEDLLKTFVPYGDRSPRRNKQNTGREILKKTPNICGDKFPDDLADSGFVLVDAWQRTQIKGKLRRAQHTLRFTFAPSNYSCVSEEFSVIQERCWKLFSDMLKGVTWTVNGYVNPFYLEQKEVPGCATIALGFSMRDPLVNGVGTESKEKPKYSLCILNGTIDLIPC